MHAWLFSGEATFARAEPARIVSQSVLFQQGFDHPVAVVLSLWSCRCGPVAVVLSLWSCRCGRLELAHTIVGIVLVARQAWCEQVGELTGFTVLSHGVDSQRDRLDYERVDKFRWWF